MYVIKVNPYLQKSSYFRVVCSKTKSFKVVTLVFSLVSLGLLRHDMSMKHTIYGHTHIVFFHPRLNWVGVDTLPTLKYLKNKIRGSIYCRIVPLPLFLTPFLKLLFKKLVTNMTHTKGDMKNWPYSLHSPLFFYSTIEVAFFSQILNTYFGINHF